MFGSNVATRKKSAAPARETREYLGPAKVAEVVAGEALIELPDGTATTAKLALAFPYQPAKGDTLLVIGRGDDHYVIGVLEGSGQTVLSFQGGVDLRAEGGPLSLSSNRGVHLSAPEVGIDAAKLRMAAESVVQKFTSVYQRVSALLSVRAREAETIVDERSLTRAKSAAILTEESMSINGKQIMLG